MKVSKQFGRAPQLRQLLRPVLGTRLMFGSPQSGILLAVARRARPRRHREHVRFPTMTTDQRSATRRDGLGGGFDSVIDGYAPINAARTIEPNSGRWRRHSECPLGGYNPLDVRLPGTCHRMVAPGAIPQLPLIIFREGVRTRKVESMGLCIEEDSCIHLSEHFHAAGCVLPSSAPSLAKHRFSRRRERSENHSLDCSFPNQTLRGSLDRTLQDEGSPDHQSAQPKDP